MKGKLTYAQIAEKLAAKEAKFNELAESGDVRARNTAKLMLQDIGQRKQRLVDENNMRSFGKGGYTKMYKDGGFLTPYKELIAQEAEKLGISPREYAAVLLQESGGNPNASFTDTKGRTFSGLIQWGDWERKNELPALMQDLGIEKSMDSLSMEDQIRLAGAWVQSRGYKPGSGVDRLYATILGGNPEATGKDELGTSTDNSNIRQGGKFYNSPDNPFFNSDMDRDIKDFPLTRNELQELESASKYRQFPGVYKDLEERLIKKYGEGLFPMGKEGLNKYPELDAAEIPDNIDRQGMEESQRTIRNYLGGTLGWEKMQPKGTVSSLKTDYSLPKTLGGERYIGNTKPESRNFNISDGLRYAAPLIDNLAASRGINRLEAPPAPVMEAPVNLDNTYDINPALDANREAVNAMVRSAMNNTGNAGMINASRAAGTAAKIRGNNELFSQKFNFENQSRNRETTINQGVNARNTDSLNRYLNASNMFRNNRTLMKSQNFANIGQDVQDTIASDRRFGMEKDMMNMYRDYFSKRRGPQNLYT